MNVSMYTWPLTLSIVPPRSGNNDPGRTRTCNPRLRRPMPYPLGHGALIPRPNSFDFIAFYWNFGKYVFDDNLETTARRRARAVAMCFAPVASTFGRPRRPRQPPAKQELPQALSKHTYKNFWNRLVLQFWHVSWVSIETGVFKNSGIPNTHPHVACVLAPRHFLKSSFRLWLHFWVVSGIFVDTGVFKIFGTPKQKKIILTVFGACPFF